MEGREDPFVMSPSPPAEDGVIASTSDTGRIPDNSESGRVGVSNESAGPMDSLQSDSKDYENDRHVGETAREISNVGVWGNLFTNPVILSNFFKICSPELLATCRLVSQDWFEQSLVHCRSSFPIILESLENERSLSALPTVPSIEIIGPLLWIKKQRGIPDFMKFVENPENDFYLKPFRKYHLKRWIFRTNNQLQKKFWYLIGNAITHLTLDECSFTTAEDFRFVIFKSCPNLKHLTFKSSWRLIDQPRLPNSDREPSIYIKPAYGEQLNLKSISFDREFPSHNFHVTWLELLSHFPNLTSISINAKRTFWTGYIIQYVSAVQLIRRHHPNKLANLKIKSSDIGPTFLALSNSDESWNLYKIVQELNFALATLQITFCSEINLWFLQEVLESHAATLSDIECVKDSPSCGLPQFPYGVTLESLKKLTVRELVFENMEFLKYFPNLEKLCILNGRGMDEGGVYNMKMAAVSNTLMANMANVKLLKLSTFHCEYTVDEDDLRSLISWLPNVESLRLVLNDKLFVMVCQHWTNLEELEDIGQTLSDYAVTGKNGGKETETEGNITRLEKLTHFTSMSCNLTDASVFNGLLKLPKLRIVTLRDDHNISKEGEAALVEKIGKIETDDPADPVPELQGPDEF